MRGTPYCHLTFSVPDDRSKTHERTADFGPIQRQSREPAPSAAGKASLILERIDNFDACDVNGTALGLAIAARLSVRQNVSMRVISLKTLREFWQLHPDAKQPLR